MSTVQSSFTDLVIAAGVGQPPVEPRALHRLRAVRQAERVSRRSMARRLNTDIRTVSQQEQESADLSLSMLYKWQAALGVPIQELLLDTGEELSAPILQRGLMLRLMKTALSIVEQSKQLKIRRMGQNLVDQMLEIMPELAGVAPWPTVGKRRSPKELGAAARRYFSVRSVPEPDD
jgi:transcriptional regulator with XRE-family HTH domain